MIVTLSRYLTGKYTWHNLLTQFRYILCSENGWETGQLRYTSFQPVITKMKSNFIVQQKSIIRSFKYASFRWHLLVQSRVWKHKNNVGNLFKVNNKDTRATSRVTNKNTTASLIGNRFPALFYCFYYLL